MGEGWENLRALILPEATQGVSICDTQLWQLCGELAGGCPSPTNLCRMNLLCSFKPAVLFLQRERRLGPDGPNEFGFSEKSIVWNWTPRWNGPVTPSATGLQGSALSFSLRQMPYGTNTRGPVKTSSCR